MFSLSGDNHWMAASFDHETKNFYSINIRAINTGNPALSYNDVFTIPVIDIL